MGGWVCIRCLLATRVVTVCFSIGQTRTKTGHLEPDGYRCRDARADACARPCASWLSVSLTSVRNRRFQSACASRGRVVRTDDSPSRCCDVDRVCATTPAPAGWSAAVSLRMRTPGSCRDEAFSPSLLVAGRARWSGRSRAPRGSRRAESGRGTRPAGSGALRAEPGRGAGDYGSRVRLRRETRKGSERPCRGGGAIPLRRHGGTLDGGPALRPRAMPTPQWRSRASSP